MTQFFTDSLIKCAKNCSAPVRNLSSNNPKRIPIPWWTEECSTAIKERRKSLKQLKANHSLNNHIEYRCKRATAQHTLKQAKRLSWQKYISSITSNTPAKQVWKMIRSMEKSSPYFVPSSLAIDNNTLTNLTEIAEKFAKLYAFISSDANMNHGFLNKKSSKHISSLDFSSDNLEPYNLPITLCELEKSI